MTSGVTVIKLGGEVVGSAALHVVARDIAELAKQTRVVVVHGGGPQATELQGRLGMTPKQVAGRRVTDEATLDVMKMVVAGKLNVDLCAALGATGAMPVGLHGASARVIAAERRPPKVYAGAGPEPVDLGLVGDVVSIGKDLLATLLDNGYLPVLACLGAGADGTVYNINADTVANRVRDRARRRPVLDLGRARRAPRRRRSVVTHRPPHHRRGTRAHPNGRRHEGMIPKLEESFAALEEGVRAIHILGRLKPGDLVREGASPGSIGTVLTKD